MFFKTDVLYKDGALALIWIAGNGSNSDMPKELRQKRTKNFRLMLETDIGFTCDIIRKYFPEMGSPYGLSLKKATLLIKGLTVIYFTKVDHLARSILEIHTKMQTINIRNIREIDLPEGDSQGRRNQPGDVQLNMEITLGFGNLEGFDDGVNAEPRFFQVNAEVGETGQLLNVSFTSGEGESVVQERRRKKRKLDEDETAINDGQVMKMLKDYVSKNSRAHCITEVELGPQPASEFDAFGDMNEGFEAYRQPSTNLVPEMVSDVGNQLLSPTRRLDTGAHDEGRGRHGQSSRRRPPGEELQVDQAMDQEDVQVEFAELQLESLEQPSEHLSGERRHRRRGRLHVDFEPQIPMLEIHERIQNQPPLDHERLRDNLAEDRETHRSRILRGLEAIHSAGRSIRGTTLSGFSKQLSLATFESASKRAVSRPNPIVEQEEQPQPDLSQGRHAETLPPQISAFGGSNIGSNIGSNVGLQQQQQQQQQQAAAGEPFEPMDFIDVNINEQVERQIPEIVVHSPILFSEEDNVNIENIIVEQLENENRANFKQLFPPESVSKKMAAVGFFRLLRLKAQRKVVLEQEEYFGDIFITKT